MSLRKWCAAPECPQSPDCGHYWFYDFRVNRKRYRNTTETANKQEAKKIEATERTKILAGRHGIREQPGITFRAFAETYLRDHAELHKRSVDRDREIIKVLNRALGGLILHEVTAHRIEQFNRELDTLRSIFSKAVEWGMLLAQPMTRVRRLKVDNCRLRILTEPEQAALLEACPKKLGRLVTLALMTGARVGELLALRWVDVSETELTFLETKNGRMRRLPMSPGIWAVLEKMPRSSAYVFTNPRTHDRYTVNGVAHTFKRALVRAGIASSDVSLHTLRHTAISQMIASGFDDYAVMGISGHSSTRIQARYTHPTDERKLGALQSFAPAMGRMWAEREDQGMEKSWWTAGGSNS